jgi:hypothetical protein
MMRNILILFFFGIVVSACSKNTTAPTSPVSPTPHDSVSSHAIVGYITDSAGRGPIYTVSVHVVSSKKDTSVLSDGKGIFRCVIFDSGTCTLTTQKTGYSPATASITLGKEKADTIRIHLNLAPSDIPTAGLESDISFKDSIKDAFGNSFSFHGQKFPMEGRIDGDTSAMLFENDDYATLTMPQPFTQNFTACVWFNDFGVDYVQDISLILENTLHEDGLQLTIQQGKPVAVVKTDSITGVVSGPVVRDGQWHFIAAVMRAISPTQTEIRLFVDGAFAVLGNLDSPIAYGNMVKFTNTFYIGGEWDSSSGMLLWPLRGMLDGVRFYNRTLTQDELLKLYHEKGL